MQSCRLQIEILVDPRRAVPRDGCECGQEIDQRVHIGGQWGEHFRPCQDGRSGCDLPWLETL